MSWKCLLAMAASVASVLLLLPFFHHVWLLFCNYTTTTTILWTTADGSFKKEKRQQVRRRWYSDPLELRYDLAQKEHLEQWWFFHIFGHHILVVTKIIWSWRSEKVREWQQMVAYILVDRMKFWRLTDAIAARNNQESNDYSKVYPWQQ